MVYVIFLVLILDIEKVYDVYFVVFKGDKMGRIMVDFLFFGGIESEEFWKVYIVGILVWWNICGVQYIYKCVDIEIGEIVGMVLGDILMQGCIEEECKFQSVGWLEGV